MDLQVKLVNDGYAQPVLVSDLDAWPGWATWRRSAFGLTYEPAVIVYHKPTFEDRPLPRNRAQLMDLLRADDADLFGRIATYDIERAGLGFLFLARDLEHNRSVWDLVAAMGAAGVKLYSSSSAILERVADGRFALGYNILGSYAESWATLNPDLGIIMPEDYTIVMSRIALVPQAAANAELGRSFLAFLMSKQGQTIMAQDVKLPALHPDVVGENTATFMQQKLGTQLRPIPIGPGLVAYLDQVKRARLIERWNETLRGN
jgi:iron(III) transport system substrate-binding protein